MKNNKYQVMGATGNTYGIYEALSPEGALDQWANENGWEYWEKAKQKAPDLFPGFEVKDGFKVVMK